jgi:hypothetical protein
MIDYIFFILIIFIIYVLLAEFFIEKTICQIPHHDILKGECDCNKKKVIENMSNFKPLIKKQIKKKKYIVDWNDYFQKSKNIFTTKDLSTSYFLKKSIAKI